MKRKTKYINDSKLINEQLPNIIKVKLTRLFKKLYNKKYLVIFFIEKNDDLFSLQTDQAIFRYLINYYHRKPLICQKMLGDLDNYIKEVGKEVKKEENKNA